MTQPAVPMKTEYWSNMTEWASRYNTWYLQHTGQNNDFALLFTYYDGQGSAYKLNDHAGSTAYNAYAVLCRNAYRDYYSEAISAPGPGGVPAYWAFTWGLVEDFIRNGNATSKTAALHILSNGAYMVNGDLSDDLYSRECAYVLRSHMDCARLQTLTAPQIARRDQCFEWSLGHCDQWVNQTADYCRPFMAGLTAKSLIQYYTTVNKDARVITKLKALADYIWTHCWKDVAGTWGAGKAFTYTDKYVVDNNDLQTAPDLNMLVVPLYGWLWYQTGEQKWRDRGDLIWTGGVSVYGGGPVAENATATGSWQGGAYLGTRSDAAPSGKQFNQQLYWAPDYITWAESDPLVGPIITPPGGGGGGGGTPTGLQSIPAVLKSLGNFAGGYPSKVIPCPVTLDAKDTAKVIFQPASDSYAALIGCLYCTSVAHILTLTSGDNVLAELEMDTYTGLAKDINGWPLIVSNRGEALKVKSSEILPKAILFYVAELKHLFIG